MKMYIPTWVDTVQNDGTRLRAPEPDYPGEPVEVLNEEEYKKIRGTILESADFQRKILEQVKNDRIKEVNFGLYYTRMSRGVVYIHMSPNIVFPATYTMENELSIPMDGDLREYLIDQITSQYEELCEGTDEFVQMSFFTEAKERTSVE